jgi:hypothetical protein
MKELSSYPPVSKKVTLKSFPGFVLYTLSIYIPWYTGIPGITR